MAPDERFKAYLQALQRNFDVSNVHSFVYMLLTTVSMPQVINQYRFLHQISKHELQDIYKTRDPM